VLRTALRASNSNRRSSLNRMLDLKGTDSLCTNSVHTINTIIGNSIRTIFTFVNIQIAPIAAFIIIANHGATIEDMVGKLRKRHT